MNENTVDQRNEAMLDLDWILAELQDARDALEPDEPDWKGIQTARWQIGSAMMNLDIILRSRLELI